MSTFSLGLEITNPDAARNWLGGDEAATVSCCLEKTRPGKLVRTYFFASQTNEKSSTYQNSIIPFFSSTAIWRGFFYGFQPPSHLTLPPSQFLTGFSRRNFCNIWQFFSGLPAWIILSSKPPVVFLLNSSQYFSKVGFFLQSLLENV